MENEKTGAYITQDVQDKCIESICNGIWTREATGITNQELEGNIKIVIVNSLGT
jgi:hypothetical protein